MRAHRTLQWYCGVALKPAACLRSHRRTTSLAHQLLIAHAENGGKTEKLCNEALAQGKQVFALGSPDNSHLLELGAAAVKAEHLSLLIE